MAVAESRLHQVPREECVLPITRSTDGEGKKFYPGDALDISLSTGTGPTLVVFTHRRHGVVYGWLDGYTLGDVATWSAKVGDWEATAVRLIPIERSVTEPSDELERCDKHGRVGCAWCAVDLEREGQQAVRLGLEDRSYIEEAQS